MLELHELTFTFGAVTAVDHVDLSVHKGAIHGLIGPNGAGKSTCIDLISGNRRPTTGKVFYEGADITGRSVRWRRHAGLARSFQRISVFDQMTVAGQLDLAARQVGDHDVDMIVAELELGSALTQECANISYGERRRVDIALALLGNPKLVLLDEPAAGLSREESLRLADHLASLARERQTTVLLVEHHLEMVFRICDRLTVLEHGRVVADGLPESVRQDPRVREAYLGRAA